VTRIDSDSIGKEVSQFCGVFNVKFFFPCLQGHTFYGTKARTDMLSFSSIMKKFPQFTYELLYGSTICRRHCRTSVNIVLCAKTDLLLINSGPRFIVTMKHII